VGSVKLRPGCRVQIDHPMPLVAEDLREIVVLAGASEVTLGHAERTKPERLDLWITEASGASTEVAALLDRAEQVAERTVVLFSGLRAPAQLPPNVHLLAEPFRTEDVLRVLDDAGLIVSHAG
jgi:hypothetical protein